MAKQEEKKKVEMFDLGAFDSVTLSNKGVWITILHPLTGEETTTRFLMLGPDSDAYVAWQDEQSKKSQEFLVQSLAQRKGKGGKKPADLELASNVDLLCELIQGWENAYWNGEELTFNKDNAKKIFTNNVVVRQQLLRDIEDRERFFTGTSKSSPTA